MLVLAPQCRLSSNWVLELDTLHALIKAIIEKFPVDTSSIYLTGQSMGGFGTWHLAEKYQELFAALIPLCGEAQWSGSPERVKVLKDVPVWVFHGAADDKVPIRMAEELVSELQKQHGNVRFTIYPDTGHDISNQTYQNPEIYQWLLQQTNTKFKLE